MGRKKQAVGEVMNRMQVKLPALSVNEGMARATVAAFISQLDPSVTELADRVGITLANISILKNGRAKAVRFETLNAICRALDCQPGDILTYVPDAE